MLKDSLIEQHLSREMKILIKPLYRKIIEHGDYFGDLEYVRFEYGLSSTKNLDGSDSQQNKKYNYARKFWDGCKVNRYLAPKNLRNIFEDYWDTMDKWHQKNKSSRISEIATKDIGMNPSQKALEALTSLHSLLINVVYSPRGLVEDSQIQSLNKLIEKLEPESEIQKCAEELRDFAITDTALKNIRGDLIRTVTIRYEELEMKIDKIHESLDKE